jgi:hypothetical protein
LRYPNIALCGKARSGKDTVAGHLVQRYGYTRLAFADPLKEMALSVDPLIPTERYPARLIHVRLARLVGDAGWEYAKDRYPEVRRLLQQMGQTVRGYDSHFWIRALLAKASAIDTPIVVTDVRYPNEHASLMRAGFDVVRVMRPGAGLADGNEQHDSETALDDFTATAGIMNAGALDELGGHVDDLVTLLRD